MTENLKNSLGKNKVGLWAMAFMTVAAIYPMAMAVSNAAAAVQYGGFAAPLIPIIGALLILLATVPILEYSRIASFAGGYYGLAELAFGKPVGKFVGLENLLYFFSFDVLTSTAFAYVIYTSLTYVSNYTLPSWAFITISIVFMFAMFLITVLDLSISSKVVIISGILQVIVLVVYSAVVIFRSPYNSLQAFNPASAPSGLSGLFLGVILAGFLFYTGYGVPLFFSEEGKASFKDVWKAIVVGVVIPTLVGVVAIYAEVVAVGLPNASALQSDLSPGLAAFIPYLGIPAAILFIIVALLGQGFGGFVPGMTTARLLFSMSRDNFIGGKSLSKVSKKGIPINAAIANLIIGIVATVIDEVVMIHFYGLTNGVFDALFLAGSMAVAFWFIHHIIPDISLAVYLHKKKISLAKPRNFLISVLAPAGAVILFVYSFYEGYSSLTEPYFGGLIFVLVSMLVVILYVIIKYKRKTLGESYISKNVSLEPLEK
jgi:amino acid transporter